MSVRDRAGVRPRYSQIEADIGFPDAVTVGEFVQDRTRYAGIMGPYGSAKTTGVLQRMRIHMAEQAPNAQNIRPSRWLATRKTYKELQTTTIKDTLNVFSGLGQFREGSGGKPPEFAFHWRNPDGTESQGTITFIALDRVEDAVASIAGLKLTGAWAHEGSQTERLVVDTMCKRVGRYPLMMEGGVDPTWSGVLIDTNSMDEDHWYFRRSEVEKPKGWKFFRQPGAVIEHPGKGRNGKSAWTLNPKGENFPNLKPSPDEYYLDGIEALDDDWVRVYLANEYGFSVDGKPVHPEYVDSVHCAREPIAATDGPIYLGQDYGRTPATIVVQYDEGQGRYSAIGEFYDEGVSAQSYAPELKRWLDREYPGKLIAGAWGDPAGGGDGNQATNDTPIQIMRDHGIPIEAAPTNEPLLRRGAVSGPMRRNCVDGHPALIISPACKQLRKGLMGGFCDRRMRLAGEYYTDKPDKNEYSHIVESFEYVLLGMGESTAPRATEFRQDEQQESATA